MLSSIIMCPYFFGLTTFYIFSLQFWKNLDTKISFWNKLTNYTIIRELRVFGFHLENYFWRKLWIKKCNSELFCFFIKKMCCWKENLSKNSFNRLYELSSNPLIDYPDGKLKETKIFFIFSSFFNVERMQ